MTDVEYAYGAPGAAENGAGRVVGVKDAARFQTLAYDALGDGGRGDHDDEAHNLSPSPRATS